MEKKNTKKNIQKSDSSNSGKKIRLEEHKKQSDSNNKGTGPRLKK